MQSSTSASLLAIFLHIVSSIAIVPHLILNSNLVMEGIARMHLVWKYRTLKHESGFRRQSRDWSRRCLWSWPSCVRATVNGQQQCSLTNLGSMIDKRSQDFGIGIEHLIVQFDLWAWEWLSSTQTEMFGLHVCPSNVWMSCAGHMLCIKKFVKEGHSSRVHISISSLRDLWHLEAWQSWAFMITVALSHLGSFCFQSHSEHVLPVWLNVDHKACLGLLRSEITS